MSGFRSGEGAAPRGCTRGLASVMLAVLGLVGCTTEARLDWRIVFGAGVSPSDVVLVEARVLRACGGDEVLWRGTGDASGAVSGGAPPRLSAGAYAFSARAFDARCSLIAEGCVPVVAPTSGTVDVELDAASATGIACPTEFPSVTPDAGAMDAGVLDAEVADAGVLDADASRVDGALPDAGPTSVDAGLDGGTPDPRVIRAVTSGAVHSCVLLGSGAVQCFGYATSLGRAYSQCEVAYLVNPTPPITNVPGLPPAVAIDAGNFHTCAATAAGEVWCWGGDGAQGELGPSSGCTIAECTECVDGAVRVDLGAGAGRVVGVAAGANHSCALTDRGEVWCWGANGQRQLGDRDPPVGGAVSVGAGRVLGVADVVEIAAGGFNTCARTRAGEVWCWGANDRGQLGAGIAGPFSGTPTRVFLMGMTATSLGISETHACAITSTGETLCWGEDADGQLGSGMASTSGTMCPIVVRAPIRAVRSVTGSELGVAVSAGGATSPGPPRCNDGSTCLLGDGGAVRCWGSNDDGRSGASVSSVATGGITVSLPAPAHAIGVGARHACAVLGERWDRLFCWGQTAVYGLFVDPPGLRFTVGEAVPIALPLGAP